MTLVKSELCLRCFKCCKKLAILLPSYSEYLEEFYQAKGFTVYNVNDGQMGLVMDHACPHLTALGCDIYEERPRVCKRYDGREDPLMKDECLWNDDTH